MGQALSRSLRRPSTVASWPRFSRTGRVPRCRILPSWCAAGSLARRPISAAGRAAVEAATLVTLTAVGFLALADPGPRRCWRGAAARAGRGPFARHSRGPSRTQRGAVRLRVGGVALATSMSWRWSRCRVAAHAAAPNDSPGGETPRPSRPSPTPSLARTHTHTHTHALPPAPSKVRWLLPYSTRFSHTHSKSRVGWESSKDIGNRLS